VVHFIYSLSFESSSDSKIITQFSLIFFLSSSTLVFLSEQLFDFWMSLRKATLYTYFVLTLTSGLKTKDSIHPLVTQGWLSLQSVSQWHQVQERYKIFISFPNILLRKWSKEVFSGGVFYLETSDVPVVEWGLQVEGKEGHFFDSSSHSSGENM
jgi:hypothetical protein